MAPREGAALADSRLSQTVLGILAVGILFRVLGIFSDFWLDEIWALKAAATLNSPLELLSSKALDGHTSLYTLIMYFLGEVPSYVHRLPALLCGTLSLLLIAHITKPYGKICQGIAVLLTSLSFILCLYTSEARGYSPMIFFGLLSLIFLERFLDHKRIRDNLGFILSATTAFFFHFTFIQCYLALAFWSLYILHKKQGFIEGALNSLKLHSLPSAAILLTYINFIRGLPEGTGPIGGYFDTIINCFGISAGLPALSPSAPGASTAILLAAIIIAVILSFQLTRNFKEGDPRALFFLLATLVIPVLFTGILRPRVLLPRYFLMSIVFGYLLFAKSIATNILSRDLKRILSISLLGAIVLGNLYSLSLFTQHGKGRYKEALKYISNNSTGETIRISGDHTFRNKMVVDYFATEIGKNLIYNELGQDTEWYLKHTLDRFEPSSSELEFNEIGKFKLEKSFDYAGLAGWKWDLYRRFETISLLQIDSNAEFTQSVPEIFKKRASSLESAPLLLTFQDASYPTYNVLIEPGSYDPNQYDLNTHSRLTLDSYRKIGITDVVETHSFLAKFQNGIAPTVELAFTSSGDEMRASVTTVVGKTRKFHLTYIDNMNYFEKRSYLRNQLLGGFSLSENELPLLIQKKSTLWIWLISILALAIVTATIFKIRLKATMS